MNTHIKPATPLPWLDRRGYVSGDSTIIAKMHRGYFEDREKDAAYIVAACNAFPRLMAERAELVAALQLFAAHEVSSMNGCASVPSRFVKEARALLAKLGAE